jgi:hypothetical protein
LVFENVESGRISFVQVEIPENLADICTKELAQIALRKLWTTLMDAK